MTNRLTNTLLALVLIAGILPVAHASPEAGYAPQKDAEGDPTPFGLPPAAGVPSTPLTAPYDLKEFGITDEDELGLHLYFDVVSFKADPTNGDLTRSTSYQIEAKLEGTKVAYTLAWYPPLPGATDTATGVHETFATLCIHQVRDEEQGFFFGDCFGQPITATIDYDKNRFDAYITKDALMGRANSDGSAPFMMPVITKGSRLSDIAVLASHSFPTFFSDRLPDDGYAASFVFATDAANSRIRLSIDRGLSNETDQPEFNDPFGEPLPPPNLVSVTPGISTLVPLRLENLNDAKRLVNLSAELGAGADKGKWSLQIAPALRVPGQDSRVVNLIVNASTKTQHRDSAVAIVRGVSLGIADELAALRLQLVASVPPAPERKTLYFHAAPDGGQGTFNSVICTAFLCGETERHWMNTLQQDETAVSDASTKLGFYGFSGSSFTYALGFDLDTPIANALVLDPSKPLEAKLVFKTSVEFPATLTFELSAGGREIASASQPATIKDGGAITFTALPMADAARIEPTDGTLNAFITIRAATTGPGAASPAAGLAFVPKDSQMTLPLVPDPRRANSTLTAGPALITLSTETHETQEFLNPGKAKIFNVTVVNEGIEADDAQLEVLYDSPEWRVELFPGSRFHLASGDGAKFALLVHAPEGAKEGDQLHILVNATSANDPNVRSQLRLVAIVTTGIEIADESAFYHEDADSSEKLVREPGRNTPGFEAVLVALGIVLVTCLRRRK